MLKCRLNCTKLLSNKNQRSKKLKSSFLIEMKFRLERPALFAPRWEQKETDLTGLDPTIKKGCHFKLRYRQGRRQIKCRHQITQSIVSCNVLNWKSECIFVRNNRNSDLTKQGFLDDLPTSHYLEREIFNLSEVKIFYTSLTRHDMISRLRFKSLLLFFYNLEEVFWTNRKIFTSFFCPKF